MNPAMGLQMTGASDISKSGHPSGEGHQAVQAPSKGHTKVVLKSNRYPEHDGSLLGPPGVS
jgi:hypothetical protein